MQFQEMRRWQMPPFGTWGYCDELPITSQLGLFPNSFFGEEEGVFQGPAAVPVKSVHPCGGHCRRKVKKGNGVGTDKNYLKEHQQRKQGRVSDTPLGLPRKRRAAMAVDEDLYKIPPELLYQMPKTKKKKRMLRKMLFGCMGFNWIR